MRYRTLGRTGLKVSELGFGAWEIGFTPPDEGDEVGQLLNRALDVGINFIAEISKRLQNIERARH